MSITPAPAQTQTEDIKAPSPAALDAPLAHTKRIARQKEYFDNQPKETIRIRKELGEQWVQINGYAFRIQAGEKVRVPTDVAEQLRDADVI